MSDGDILNVTITILAGYLLFNEFSTFLLIKPTQTSLEQSSLMKKYFPVVIICLEPAFNLAALKTEDYRDIWNLWTGNTNHTLNRNNSRKMRNFNLWGGKRNESQNQVIEKVIIGSNSSNWIDRAIVKYEKLNGRVVGHYEWIKVKLIPLRAANPMGKCLQLDIPEEVNESKIIKIGIQFNKTVMGSLDVENAKVYFRDPNANVQFILPPFMIK